MRKITAIALSVLTLGAACTVFAPSSMARPFSINHRQYRQSNRIAGGNCSGSLTGRESVRLQKQQAALARREARMRASGCGLSPSERARLQHQQNQLSSNIYRQKHDGQSR